MSTNKPAGGAQFTPGPWVVNTFIVNGQHKLEVLDATGANACVQANAHLIAAAPAMYEALQQLVHVEQLRKQAVTENDYVDLVLADSKLQQLVQAVLAQAEGRQG